MDLEETLTIYIHFPTEQVVLFDQCSCFRREAQEILKK